MTIASATSAFALPFASDRPRLAVPSKSAHRDGGRGRGGRSGGRAGVAREVEISFYFPVAVGGTVAALMARLVEDFEREHPEIRVRPIYAGTYQEALAKSLTGLKSGTPPDLAVLFAADMYTLIDADAIVPFDEVSAAAKLDPAWMEGFFRR